MDTFIKIAQFICSLSLLIILHELGHYLPAKWFKTRVEKFFLFFDAWGKALFKKKIGETLWGIGWLPLGGYVKIAGMIDESMDTAHLKEDSKPWEFRSKKAWQRLIIMAGGVIMNVLVGFIIYAGITFTYGTDTYASKDVKYGLYFSPQLQKIGFETGDQIIKIDDEEATDISLINKDLLLKTPKTITVKHLTGKAQTINIPEQIGDSLFHTGEIEAIMPQYPFKVDKVEPNSPAEQAGMKAGDKITQVNDKNITYFSDFKDAIRNQKTVILNFERGAEKFQKQVSLTNKGFLGFVPIPTDFKYINIHHHNYGFFESIGRGIAEGLDRLYMQGAQFKYLFTKKGASQIGGFGTMVQLFGSEWNWLLFWERTAMLSLMLAFMNILPIPALDGGHIVFTLWEIITGKKPGDKFLEKMQLIGFITVLALLLWANGNDIYRWITS